MRKVQYITRFLLFLAVAIAGPLAGHRQAAAEEGELFLVRYEEGAKSAVANEVMANGGAVRHEFDRIGVLAVSLSGAAAGNLAGFTGVTAVDVDPLYYPANQTTPYGIDMVQARDAWDANRDGQIDPGAPIGAGIRVCVVDTGIWLTHEDLGGGGVNVVAGRSWVGEDWAADRQGHGTHVAGTVAAMNNDVGVVGVSPGAVDLIIADVFNDNGDGQASSTILAAANWCAEQGARIISMSLGGLVGGLDDGYQALYEQGILIVAAAGNDGAPVQSYPASYPSVVSVAAVDYTGAVADFSNFPLTNEVELAAPGVAVLSAYPFENSVAVAGGPTFIANPVVNAATAGVHTLGPTADGGDCNLPPTPGAYTGKVVLCERGGLAFRVKIDNAVSGGAVGVILYNDEPGNFSGTYGPLCCSPVPAVSVSQADGHELRDNWLGLPVAFTIDQESDSGYTELSGTSMATPHASGAAAVLWSACPSLTNDQIRSHLASFTLEPDADLIPGRDPFYGLGIVQLKDAVDALFDGIDDYNPANPNHDGRNPANVECPTSPPPPPGGAAQGAGWLATNEGKKLNFNFSAAVESGVAGGQLRLRDDVAGARIEANSVTAVGPVNEPCGGVSAGANALEFHSAGAFNGSPATFRACVEDNGQPGNNPDNPDRFYLECLSGCAYNTGARVPHNGLGGGNIQVREAAGGSGGGSAQSEATVLALDPFFLSNVLAGGVLNLAVAAYDADGQPLADAPVTLTQTLANGTAVTLSGLTGLDGLALFTVTAVLGDSEYVASVGDLSSNGIRVKGLLR